MTDAETERLALVLMNMHANDRAAAVHALAVAARAWTAHKICRHTCSELDQVVGTADSACEACLALAALNQVGV